MPFYFFMWDGENEQHLAEHDISIEEFEEIVSHPDVEDISRRTGRPMAFGMTSSGKYIACVFEFLDDTTVYPVTAYEVDN